MTVALYDDNAEVPWRRISPRLASARRIGLLLAYLPFLLATAVLAATVSRWLWGLPGVVAALFLWQFWLIGRQVSAISYAELPEEIVIRRGRLFRRLVSIPYGRLQYADMGSGPLERHFGLASVTIHTASPASGGRVPGLELPAAEALRERLTARGEAQRAGL
ncbi:MAG TPA: PH domain-containing protein [Tetrasphaera sp.]|jgi:membrane protein YdbS with pleckstrin-like domain|uniref:PH domain-containing protein n=1 Tax=Nostocoides vanveenii TaxID=330835 RepID=A0ABN2L3T3_9MICO|nr:PH domain-containing protein [Tetrasphaera sp.]HNQ06724.1 PH domain-containing protein [Tetrasphaera sp.]